MLKHYFRIALRNLLKNRTSSFINIAGLSVGMSIVILIGLYIWDEVAFDHYHQNHRDAGANNDQPAIQWRDIYNADSGCSKRRCHKNQVCLHL